MQSALKIPSQVWVRYGFDVFLQAKQRAVGILNSLDDVGKTILSRILVGEEPREMLTRSVSLLVAREEPDLLAGSVISSQGSSFTLPSSTNLFGNETQFVETQVTFKTSRESSYDTALTYFFSSYFPTTSSKLN